MRRPDVVFHAGFHCSQLGSLISDRKAVFVSTVASVLIGKPASSANCRLQTQDLVGVAFR